MKHGRTMGAPCYVGAVSAVRLPQLSPGRDSRHTALVTAAAPEAVQEQQWPLWPSSHRSADHSEQLGADRVTVRPRLLGLNQSHALAHRKTRRLESELYGAGHNARVGGRPCAVPAGYSRRCNEEACLYVERHVGCFALFLCLRLSVEAREA